MADRETIIDRGGDGGGGIIAGMGLAAIIVIGAFLYFGSMNGASRTIDIDVPKVTIGVTPDGQ